MAYETLRFRIIGACPILFHNGRLADPLDPHSLRIAAIAAKRKKTQADHLALAELEFLGGLYLSGGRPCLPGEMVESALVRGAALERRGPKARAGLVVPDDPPLLYDGPDDPRELWAREEFRLRVGVRVSTSRIMRTRPMFRVWAAELRIDYLPGLLDPKDVASFLRAAGEQVGLGDWRPRFGRFRVEDLPGS